MGEFSSDEEDAILSVSIIAGCFSFVGASFVITMFLKFSFLRGFAYRLILYLAISDLGSAIFIIISPFTEEGSGCQFQAIGMSFFGLSSVLWVDAIACSLYSAIVSQQPKVHRHEKWLVVGIFSYCLFISLLPLSTDSYTMSSTGFCWLSEEDSDRSVALFWQMIQFYLPLWGSFVFSLICYYKVYNTVKNIVDTLGDVDDQDRTQRLKTIKKLRFFPLVLIIAWFFGTINRIYLFFEHDNPNLVLAILQNLFGNIIGLMNCIVYGMNQQVMDALRTTCCAKEMKSECELQAQV